MPNTTGKFHLYSDTSKFAMGSALYKMQNGKPKLIAYVSKRLPEATKNYFITELELCGLAVNKASFSHLLNVSTWLLQYCRLSWQVVDFFMGMVLYWLCLNSPS